MATVEYVLTNGRDTYVDSSNPNTAYNTLTVLRAGKGGGAEFRTFLDFDLTGIPANAEILSATLRLYAYDVAFSGTIAARRVAGAFTPASTTWNAQPTTVGNTMSTRTFFTGSSPGFYEWSVLEYVQRKHAGTGDANAIALVFSGTSDIRPSFWSSEYTANASRRPALVVTYNIPPSKPTLTSPNGGETLTGVNTITWTPSTDAESPTSSLRYQIQYSANNGATWAGNIVALTDAGATSYDYDFNMRPETSLGKLRIRAFDGDSYSAWDESDGVFTILYNTAPLAPSSLSPSATSIDRTRSNVFAWNHNDTDAQSKADIQWRVQGATTWNDVVSNGDDRNYIFSGGTFPLGQVEWRVRTYDSQLLVSPWSNIAVFTASDPSTAPVIVQPSTSVSVARPVIEWTSVNQASYQVVIRNSLNAIVWDTGEVVSTNRAITSGIDLDNGASYTIQVRIKDGGGLFSSYANRLVSVSYTPPAMPTVVAEGNNGAISLVITADAPTGTQPATQSYEVYKRIDGDFKRIAYGVQSVFIDYHVASETDYVYYVRAIGDNGTTATSEEVTASVTLTGVYIHALREPAFTAHYFRYAGVGYSDNFEPESALMRYAGRRKPVIHYGLYEEYSITRRIQEVEGMGDIQALRAFARNRETIVYRDDDGNLVVGFLGNIAVDKQYRVSETEITVIETAHTEEV